MGEEGKRGTLDNIPEFERTEDQGKQSSDIAEVNKTSPLRQCLVRC